MATHTKTIGWGSKSHTSSSVSWSVVLSFLNAYKEYPYQYTTKVSCNVKWRTNLDATPGDLKVNLATSIENANKEAYIWTSSTHQSYGSWKTFTFEIPLEKFMQIVASNGELYLYFRATVIRKWYMDSASMTITYTIPDITYTYKDWNGTVLKTQTVEEGTSPTPPSDPTRAADAQYTYTFSGWSLSGTTYTAQYTATKRSYAITTNTDGNGTVTGGGTYEYGSTVTLIATPNTGYKFKQWSDGDTNNPRTVTVTGAATYTAQFAVDTINQIYIGNDKVEAVYLGTTKVKAVYIGTKKIYG